jgi:hypothetical protein
MRSSWNKKLKATYDKKKSEGKPAKVQSLPVLIICFIGFTLY